MIRSITVQGTPVSFAQLLTHATAMHSAALRRVRVRPRYVGPVLLTGDLAPASPAVRIYIRATARREEADALTGYLNRAGLKAEQETPDVIRIAVEREGSLSELIPDAEHRDTLRETVGIMSPAELRRASREEQARGY